MEKEEQEIIFKEMAKIDGIQELFKSLMDKDIKLHFNCKPEEQDLVRGSYYRTEYLLKKVKAYSLDN